MCVFGVFWLVFQKSSSLCRENEIFENKKTKQKDHFLTLKRAKLDHFLTLQHIYICIYIYALRPYWRLHFCWLLVWLPTQDFLCIEIIKVVLLSGLGSLPSSPVLSFFSVSYVGFDCMFRKPSFRKSRSRVQKYNLGSGTLEFGSGLKFPKTWLGVYSPR